MHVAEPPPSDPTRALYTADIETDGYVNNLTRLWSWRPDVLEAFMATRATLISRSSLTESDTNVLFAATAGARGDSYCALHWGTLISQQDNEETAVAVVTGNTESLDQRRQALTAWARRVVGDPNGIDAGDIEQLRALNLTDREIFEATFLVAWRLAFTTVNDALGVQPDAQLANSAPPGLRAAVHFGRPPAEMPSSAAPGGPPVTA